MKFIVDADCPRSLLAVFRKHEHEATHAIDVLGPASDDEIFEHASKNKLVIVTRDLEFAGILTERKGYGVLLVRLPYYFTADKICKVFDEFLGGTESKEFAGSITVLELGKIRIRKL